MPQPTPAPAPPAENPHGALLKRIEDTPADERTSAQKQIFRAVILERERAVNMKKIAANREYLRLMDENEELTDAETDFLDDWYPQKEKGQARSEDDVERTRKVKAAAIS